MMKKALPVLILALAALFMVACSQPASTSAIAPASSSKAASEGFLEGVVIDATMNGIMVQAADGTEMLFGTEGVPVDGGDGVGLGDTVRIIYVGTLDTATTNMQEVTLERIEIVTPAVNSVDGTIIDATMNGITIETADGQSYLFGTDGVPVTGGDGIVLGDEVTVFFVGTLQADTENMQDVTVETVVITKAAPEAPAPQSQAAPAPVATPAQPHHAETPPANPNPPTDYISGTVTDASMNTLSIETIYGTAYQFSTEDATVNAGQAGLSIGEVVAVYFNGELDENSPTLQPVMVTKVNLLGGAPSSGGEAAPETTDGPDIHILNGTVEDASMGTLYMSDATGVIYLFSTENASIEAGSGGLNVGDAITVYYVGTLQATDQLQEVTVEQVQVHH